MESNIQPPILLTPEEEKIFNKFLYKYEVQLTNEEYELVRRRRIVRTAHNQTYTPPGKTTCILSGLGRNYLAYLYQTSKQEKKDDKRYWITTGIALAALFKSFLPEISAIVASVLKLLGQ